MMIGLWKEWGIGSADIEEQQNGIHNAGHSRHHAKLPHRRPHGQQRRRLDCFPASRHCLR